MVSHVHVVFWDLDRLRIALACRIVAFTQRVPLSVGLGVLERLLFLLARPTILAARQPFPRSRRRILGYGRYRNRRGGRGGQLASLFGIQLERSNGKGSFFPRWRARSRGRLTAMFLIISTRGVQAGLQCERWSQLQYSQQTSLEHAETYLDQILPFRLCHERLKLGRRKCIDKSGLADDEEQHLGPGERRQLVRLVTNRSSKA